MASSTRCRLAAVLVATAAAYAASGARLASAQENPAEADACFTAAERAQPLFKQKRLREARAELEVCARDVCPRIARTDCRDWLADVARVQPSIVIAAREVNEAQGTRDVTGAHAIIDGAIVLDKVDPAPIPIDPGQHHIRLERPGFATLEQNVDVREGEKARVVTFSWQRSFSTSPSPPPAEPSRPTPASVYVLGAIGIAGLGVGAYFEGTGLNQRNGLAKCAPFCSQSSVNSARDTVRTGDITLGVGALFVVAAGIWYLARPTVMAPRVEDQATLIGGPIPGGFALGVRGRL